MDMSQNLFEDDEDEIGQQAHIGPDSDTESESGSYRGGVQSSQGVGQVNMNDDNPAAAFGEAFATACHQMHSFHLQRDVLTNDVEVACLERSTNQGYFQQIRQYLMDTFLVLYDGWVTGSFDSSTLRERFILFVKCDDAFDKAQLVNQYWACRSDLARLNMFMAVVDLTADPGSIKKENYPDPGSEAYLELIDQFELHRKTQQLQACLQKTLEFINCERVTAAVFLAVGSIEHDMDCEAGDETEGLIEDQVIHKLVRYVLSTFHGLYRIHGKTLYRDIYNKDGFRTHAYEAVETIEEYLNKVCSRHYNSDIWKLATKNKQTWSWLVQLLTQHRFQELPEFKPSRYLIAFQNGIYHLMYDVFYNFEDEAEYQNRVNTIRNDHTLTVEQKTIALQELNELNVHGLEYNDRLPEDWSPELRAKPTHIDPNWCAITFIDQHFDDATIMSVDNLSELYTPNFDHIFTSQDTGLGSVFVAHAMFGRFFFPGNVLDHWDKALCIFGIGGSGKTLLLHVLEVLMPENDMIFRISNKVEKVFGLGPALANDRVLAWVIPEMRSNSSLDQSLFQQIITKEVMSCALKGRDPIQKQWLTHGMVLGNQFAGEDSGGSLVRRLDPMFNFNNYIPPHQRDADLLKKISANLPTLLRKVVLAYQLLAQQNRHKADPYLGMYFDHTNRQLNVSINTIDAFLDSSHILHAPSPELLENYYCLMTELTQRFQVFCMDMGRGRMQVQGMDWQNALQGRNCVTVRETRLVKGRQRRGEFVIGIRLSNPDEEESAADQDDDGGGAMTTYQAVEQLINSEYVETREGYVLTITQFMEVATVLYGDDPTSWVYIPLHRPHNYKRAFAQLGHPHVWVQHQNERGFQGLALVENPIPEIDVDENDEEPDGVGDADMAAVDLDNMQISQ